MSRFKNSCPVENVRVACPVPKRPEVYQLSYVSLSKTPLDETLLSNILSVSEKNNTRDGISGVLMYRDQLFFQILEGDRARVKECYRRIVNDQRHSAISLMWEDETETQTFSSWAMGYAGPDEIGLHDGRELASLADLDSSRGAKRNTANVALQLARVMFRRLTVIDRFGLSVST
jgi:hypothetical protein